MNQLTKEVLIIGVGLIIALLVWYMIYYIALKFEQPENKKELDRIGNEQSYLREADVLWRKSV